MKKTGQNELDNVENKEHMLGALLRIPYQALTRRIQQGLMAAGYPEFHASHMAVMQHIQPGGSGMSEIAEQTHMSKQALNYLVEFLEGQGYVQRRIDPHDGRAKLLYLTAQGKEVERQARQIIKNSEVEWAEHVGVEEMQQLKKTLQDLAELLESDQ